MVVLTETGWRAPVVLCMCAGKKPGEVKMIRRGESVEAHQVRLHCLFSLPACPRVGAQGPYAGAGG